MADPKFDRYLRADAAIHALGLVLGVVGAIAILTVAARASQPGQIFPILVYVVGLLAMLSCSAAYNLRLASPRREWLRRLDHAAIFVMIAGTYSGIAFAKPETQWAEAAAAIWAMALAGAALKLIVPHRFEAVATWFYLGLGWIALLALVPVLPRIPAAAVALMIAGGAIYSLGVVFHLQPTLRFHNAIWHACVLAAAMCHFSAVVIAAN